MHGLLICKRAPVVSKLFFANDTLIFCRATVPEIRWVKDILRIYEEASGQVINLGKSEIMFSGGLSEEKGDELAMELGVQRVDQHVVYLGVSIFRVKE